MDPVVDKKANARYKAIMIAARDLFWKYGVRRVTVEEISRDAGVSKMTFYKFFPNKTELAKSIFLEMVEESLAKFRELLKSDDTPAEKLRQLIALKVQGTKGISREFVMDLYNDKELGLKEYVEDLSKESWTMILDYFRDAQSKGVFRKDLDPEFFMYYGQKISEMVTDEHLIKMYGSTEEVIRQLTNFFAYGISQYPDK